MQDAIRSFAQLSNGLLSAASRRRPPPRRWGAYIGEMSGFGSRASLPVAAVTIVKFHVDEGLESSCADSGVLRTLAEMADRKPPFTGRSKPLGLDCYLALRETALQ